MAGAVAAANRNATETFILRRVAVVTKKLLKLCGPYFGLGAEKFATNLLESFDNFKKYNISHIYIYIYIFVTYRIRRYCK
jgi:hypothetical protein